VHIGDGMKVCKRCGADWKERVKNPRYCPLCKSPYWDKERRDAEVAARGSKGVGSVEEAGGGQKAGRGNGAAVRGVVFPGDAVSADAEKAVTAKTPGHHPRCKCSICVGGQQQGRV